MQMSISVLPVLWKLHSLFYSFINFIWKRNVAFYGLSLWPPTELVIMSFWVLFAYILELHFVVFLCWINFFWKLYFSLFCFIPIFFLGHFVLASSRILVGRLKFWVFTCLKIASLSLTFLWLVLLGRKEFWDEVLCI